MEEQTEHQGIPWEARKTTGFFSALWATIKEVVGSPRNFFQKLQVRESNSDAVVFYVIMGTAVAILSFLTDFALRSILNMKSGYPQLPAYAYLIIVLAMPLLMFVALYASTAILHLFVIIFGGKGGFKATLQVLAYNASTSVFSIIPFVGQLIAGVWAIVVGVIGFKKVHNLGTFRAFMAYFAFPVIGIILLMAAIAIPNLLGARLKANEALAEATIRTISTAIESYAAINNGKFPKEEADLVIANPPYLNAYYSGLTKKGYKYSLSLSPDGYEITAQPSDCGVTGKKVFITRTQGVLSQEECKR